MKILFSQYLFPDNFQPLHSMYDFCVAILNLSATCVQLFYCLCHEANDLYQHTLLLSVVRVCGFNRPVSDFRYDKREGSIPGGKHASPIQKNLCVVDTTSI
ncbi:hypothetical protein Mapa_015306 [Marchantia paleacea]|nr:hypothetical protein Mapa_015306 [Marchantia paleacea]